MVKYYINSSLRIIVMKILIKFYPIIILLTLSSTVNSKIVDKVIAVVNDEPITLSALENELFMIGSDDNSLEKQRIVLDELIDRKLMLQVAREKYGYDQPWAIPDEDIKAEVAKLISQFPTEKLFYEWLNRVGMEIDDITEDRWQYLMISNMVKREFADFQNPVSKEEASKYFEAHKTEFIEAEKVRMQRIRVFSSLADKEEMLAAKTKAEEIWQKLTSGTSFDRIKETYEKDSSVNVFSEADYDVIGLIPALQGAISHLEIDEISKPIETAIGYFIIKITNRKSARQKSSQEVSGEIGNILKRERMQKELDKWLKKQQESADVRILEAKFVTLTGD